MVKTLPANAGDAGLIPGWRRSPGEGNDMTTCSSILAWKLPWTEEPGGLQSMGSLTWLTGHKVNGSQDLYLNGENCWITDRLVCVCVCVYACVSISMFISVCLPKSIDLAIPENFSPVFLHYCLIWEIISIICINIPLLLLFS